MTSGVVEVQLGVCWSRSLFPIPIVAADATASMELEAGILGCLLPKASSTEGAVD